MVPERFQEVVNRLQGRATFVQVGSAKDVPLAGAIDLRADQPPRDRRGDGAAEAFVRLVGSRSPRACGRCPAVIVYGGPSCRRSPATRQTESQGQAPCARTGATTIDPGQRMHGPIGADRVIATLEQLSLRRARARPAHLSRYEADQVAHINRPTTAGGRALAAWRVHQRLLADRPRFAG